MSGIYLHIPFCRKACHYCNFHFSTSLKLKNNLVRAMVAELHMRQDFLEEKHLKSIYFGGGTPSLLEEAELCLLIESLAKYYTWDTHTEITLEANPDDLDPEKLKSLRAAGINRLSIGIQSFFEEDLRFMNRSHTAAQSERVIADAQAAGFSNITADLIYGAPTSSDDRWEQNIMKLTASGVNHISAYALTVEERTALHHMIHKGSVQAPADEAMEVHFRLLIEKLEASGFHQYEISNFAKPGFEAIHNSGYWQGTAYLGLGPSAHSFRSRERSWNVANNPAYIKSIESGKLPLTVEVLKPADEFNEYIMTGLRKSAGIDEEYISSTWPDYISSFLQEKEVQLHRQMIVQQGNIIKLTGQGKWFADGIAASFFVVD
jgi:oxygen-independent coproporphyrinogen-3 oxidase